MWNIISNKYSVFNFNFGVSISINTLTQQLEDIGFKFTSCFLFYPLDGYQIVDFKLH